MYANNSGTGYANANIFYLFLGAQQQWGVWNCSLGRTSVTVTLPIAFENMCTVALATPTGAPWDGVGTYAITSRKTSQITIYGDYSQTSINSDALVIALGF